MESLRDPSFIPTDEIAPKKNNRKTSTDEKVITLNYVLNELLYFLHDATQKDLRQREEEVRRRLSRYGARRPSERSLVETHQAVRQKVERIISGEFSEPLIELDENGFFATGR